MPTVDSGPGIEKRQQRRFAIDAPLIVSTRGRVIDEQARLHNFCIGGVFFYSSATLQPGQPVEIVLTLPRTIGLPTDREFCWRGTALRVESIGVPDNGVAVQIQEYCPIVPY